MVRHIGCLPTCLPREGILQIFQLESNLLLTVSQCDVTHLHESDMQSIAIVQSFHPDTHGDERSTRAHNRQYSVSDPETRRPLGWCTIFPSAGSPARSRQFQIYSTLPLRSPIPEGSGCLPDTRPSENDWNVMRPTIKRLYCRHEQRLEDVVEIMKLVYGFSAS